MPLLVLGVTGRAECEVRIVKNPQGPRVARMKEWECDGAGKWKTEEMAQSACIRLRTEMNYTGASAKNMCRETLETAGSVTVGQCGKVASYPTLSH